VITPMLSLTALTLLICGAVAGLPAIVRPSMLRSVPRSVPQASGSMDRELWVVQAPGERWFLNGAAISRDQLATRLRRSGSSDHIHHLPSAALSMAEIHRGMQWLRQGGASVALELPGWR
jgi:hypothetical protein